jgi:hypothetical protein
MCYASSVMSNRGSETLKLMQRLIVDTTNKVELEIHRYRISEHIGGTKEMFAVNQARVQNLIERGYKDTQFHDCDKSECLRPQLFNR